MAPVYVDTSGHTLEPATHTARPSLTHSVPSPAYGLPGWLTASLTHACLSMYSTILTALRHCFSLASDAMAIL